MKHRTKLIVLMVALILLAHTPGHLVSQASDNSEKESIIKQAQTVHARGRALMGLLEDDLANPDPERRPDVVRAIYELGDLRYAAASGILAEYLNFKIGPDEFPRHPMKKIELETFYPAIDALISIGEPALPAVADAVAARERGEWFKQNAKFVVAEIRGVKQSNAWIQDRISLYDNGRERLQELMIPGG